MDFRFKVKQILSSCVICLLGFSLAKAYGPAANAVTDEEPLRVQEYSTVNAGQSIKLGHLLANSSQRFIEDKYYDLTIYESLSIDQTIELSAQNLSRIIRSKLSFQDLQNLNLKTPEKITVKAVRNFISHQDLSRQLMKAVRASCMGCDVEIDELNVPEFKDRSEILQVRLDTKNYRGGASFLLPMQISTSQGAQTYWVTGKVSTYKLAPVATRLIQPQERITSSDFEIQRMNVTHLRDGVPKAQDLIGKKAIRGLSLGHIILAGDVKNDPAVLRGQTVKLVIGDESFEISTTGVSEQNGSIGDLIKVKQLDNKKTLTGILIEPGVVKVN